MLLWGIGEEGMLGAGPEAPPTLFPAHLHPLPSGAQDLVGRVERHQSQS